ncbi:MAG: VOC family protein [Planctomycetes bacterium]|nr:VOC family protein [Planctomycetota bacterium]
MGNSKQPTYGNGKICYIEIPATDIDRSVAFYKEAFGWQIRRRGDGQLAFDDAVNEVSGSWVTGRPPQSEPGLLIYIMVEDIHAAVKAVIANGGSIVQEIGVDAPEITARFTDPAGNVLGLYQRPKM